MSNRWQMLRGRWEVAMGLFRFLWQQRLWWMIPIVGVLLLFGILLFVGLQTPLGPFIYTLF